jgi:hypothetical protein
LLSTARGDFLPINQFVCLMIRSICFRSLTTWCFHVNLLSSVIPKYVISVSHGIGLQLMYTISVRVFFVAETYVTKLVFIYDELLLESIL